ncbi:mucin-13 [Nothoprocta perdicaria]|uniref:mucin-13 n=1 Tax=Nothoprocta perdicaria TaxID=30464 RepID=UPI000E1BD4C9|nr:mucin-13 [Nothoprocta perdicaria]
MCSSRPCGTYMAKCIALHSTFACVCPYGFYHKDKNCHVGKIFPGLITLEWSYSSAVQVINSTMYEEVFLNVTAFFQGIFINEKSFGQTVIVEIQEVQGTGTGRAMRRSSSVDNPMNITLMNIFAENSNITEEDIADAINTSTSSGYSGYRATSHCAVSGCDLRTTECNENGEYAECECKEDYRKTNWYDRSCSDCSSECSAANNQICVKENGVPACKCLDNFERKDNRCVACAVGYSGENCKNNSKLILIIVGTVLGAIVLIFLIAIIVISTRSKHKRDPERKSLIKSGYLNSEGAGNTQTRMFPRVQTTSGHANPGYEPNNPYEMDYSSRSSALEREYDDEYEIAKEPDGFRLQRRY